MSGQRLGLVDSTRRMSPNGSQLAVARLLEKSMPLMKDGSWMETNKTDSHITALQAGLPRSFRRRLNKGVPISKATTVQNEEATTLRHSMSEVDVLYLARFKDKGAARAEEAKSFIEGIGQDFERDLLYGSIAADPEGIDGLAVRYNSLSGNRAQNVLSAGGTGNDNTSIYLVNWGEGVGFIYPQSSDINMAGAVYHRDLGEQYIQTTENGQSVRMLTMADLFAVEGGWCIKDWRSVVRICNIDVSNLTSQTNPATLRALLAKAIHRLPNNGGMPRIYMNRTAVQYLDIERLTQVGSAGMTYADVDGHVIPHFRGIPIRVDDNILDTESRVA